MVTPHNLIKHFLWYFIGFLQLFSLPFQFILTPPSIATWHDLNSLSIIFIIWKKAMVFPVVMYGCESRTVKKAESQRIDAFELWCWRRLLRVPRTARRSNQSILKEISWMFFGRTDAEAETPVLWPPHVKSWLIGKDSDAGRDCRQEERGTTEDDMAGWHHRLDGREFEWTPGDGDGQRGLACCDSWGRKESDTTERLSWTELKHMLTSR